MPHSVPPPAPPPIVHVLSPETANKAFLAAPQPTPPDDQPVPDPLVVEWRQGLKSPPDGADPPAAVVAEGSTPEVSPSPSEGTDSPSSSEEPVAPVKAQPVEATPVSSGLTSSRREGIAAPGAIAPPEPQRADRAPEATGRPRFNRPAPAGSAIAPEVSPVVEAAPDAAAAAQLLERPPFRAVNAHHPIPPLYSPEASLPTPEASAVETPVEAVVTARRNRPSFQRPASPPPIPPLYSEQAAQLLRQQRAEVLGAPVSISLQDFFPERPEVEFSVTPAPPADRVQSLGAEQLLELVGRTALLSMLSELQQLSGATLVAQSRQDRSQRQILTIPETEEGEGGSADTGIPEELQIPVDGGEDEPGVPVPEAEEIDRPDADLEADEAPDGVDLPPVEVDDPTLELPSADSPQTPLEAIDLPDETASPEDLLEAPLEDGAIALPTGLDVLELDADYVDYDSVRQVLLAEGNVELRFRQAVLTADQLRVNLPNRQAVAQGNVVFTRGEQILLGDRLDYNLTQGAGNVTGVRGEVFLPTSSEDLTILPNDAAAQSLPSRPLSRTLEQNQPDLPVEGPGGIAIGVGTGGTASTFGLAQFGGEIRRFRFEAESAEFYPNGWAATNVRLTNDPFSPPELELRSPFVTYTRLSPLRAELRARNPVLVFDQGFRLPLWQDRVIISNEPNDPPLAQIGFDDDLGGLFLERPINLITTSRGSFSIAPLILVQRAVEDNGFNIFDPTSLGAIFRLNYAFGPDTLLTWRGVLESLEFSDLENQFRSNLRLRQAIGNHQLTLEYAYRNRFFNGSLGFQNVESSIGFVVTSPRFILGDTGINLTYQAGAQYITALTNRPEFLDVGEFLTETSLYRAQGSAALSRSFTLWQGDPLPRTREEGLRFTATPVIPFLRIVTSARGVFSAYSNEDIQSTLTGSIGLRGQLGNFSRNAFDYTAFNITLSETVGEGQSPFLFDRAVDRSVLSFGIVQQIYGPFLAGFQTSFNLDTNTTIDTVYTLEYSRRTYSVILRFSPIRESGSLSLQINDFDWNNLRDPFSGPTGAVTVESGVPLSGN